MVKMHHAPKFTQFYKLHNPPEWLHRVPVGLSVEYLSIFPLKYCMKHMLVVFVYLYVWTVE